MTGLPWAVIFEVLTSLRPTETWLAFLSSFLPYFDTPILPAFYPGVTGLPSLGITCHCPDRTPFPTRPLWTGATDPRHQAIRQLRFLIPGDE